jgi:hypothetical protein
MNHQLLQQILSSLDQDNNSTVYELLLQIASTLSWTCSSLAGIVCLSGLDSRGIAVDVDQVKENSRKRVNKQIIWRKLLTRHDCFRATTKHTQRATATFASRQGKLEKT